MQLCSIAIPAKAEILKACKTRMLKRHSIVSGNKTEKPTDHNKRVHFNQAH